MRRDHFNCVGIDLGAEAVFDLRGRWVQTVDLIRPAADRVASELVADAPWLDWSGWHVEVYDAKGRRVLDRAFADAAQR